MGPVGESALSFAGLLRQLRAEANFLAEELAEATGLSPRSISDLERGISRTARKYTAAQLADALSLPSPPMRAVFASCSRPWQGSGRRRAGGPTPRGAGSVRACRDPGPAA